MPAAGVYEEFGFLFTAKDLASAVIKKTGSAVDAVAGGVQASLDGIVSGVETTGVALAKGLKIAAKPFGSVFGDAVESAASLATRAFINMTPTIDKAVAGVGSTIDGLKRGFKDTFKAMDRSVADFAISAADKMVSAADAVEAFPGKVKGAFALAKKALVTHANEIKTNVKDATVGAFEAAKGAITSGGQALTTFGKNVKETGKTVFDFVTKKEFSFEQFFDATVKGAGIAYDTLKQGAKDTAESFKKGITGAVTNLGETFANAKKGVLDFWQDFKNRTGETAVTFKTGVLSATTSFFESVKKNAPVVGDKLKGLWKRFKEWDQAKLPKDALGGLKVPGGGPKGGGKGGGFDLGAIDGAVKGFGKIRTAVNAIGPLLKGAMLGPLGLILKVLEPIIDVFEDTFEPILDDIKIAVKNAFAPLEAIMENVGQTLIPIIMKGLQPFVSILTLAAAQVGRIFQSIGKGKGPALGLGKVFTTLGPVFNKLATALGAAAQKILPVIFKLVEKMAPILGKIVEILAGQLTNTIEVISDILADAGPDLIDAVGDLAEALLPLVASAIKLGSALLKYVFAPLLVKAVQGIALIVKHVITPFVNWFVPKVTSGIQFIIDSVVDFYGNFSKYMNDLWVLFIEPIISWFTDDIPAFFKGLVGDVEDFFGGIFKTVQGWMTDIVTWISDKVTGILKTLGLDDVADAVGGVFQNILAAIQSPIEAIKKLINKFIIEPLNSLLTYDLPVIGKLSDILGIQPITPFAEGGIVKHATNALIGEAGPEAVVPLKPEPIREIVAPVVADLEMPMLKEVVTILTDIHRALTGELRVRVKDTGNEGGGSQQALARNGASEASDLGSAIPVVGIVR